MNFAKYAYSTAYLQMDIEITRADDEVVLSLLKGGLDGFILRTRLTLDEAKELARKILEAAA